MATTDSVQRALKDAAVYESDNGRLICAGRTLREGCAGTSAYCTGRDISGQRVRRIDLDDVREWPEDLGALRCECGRVTLHAVVGPDGFPAATVRA